MNDLVPCDERELGVHTSVGARICRRIGHCSIVSGSVKRTSHSQGAAHGSSNCVNTPNRFIQPNALPQYWTAPLGPKTQSTAATMNGTAKCSTPYGNHARTSKNAFVYLVCRSLMFAPYRTDSSAGRRLTWIVGRWPEGIYRAEKKVMSHAKMGVAGRTNCEVIGRSRAVA